MFFESFLLLPIIFSETDATPQQEHHPLFSLGAFSDGPIYQTLLKILNLPANNSFKNLVILGSKSSNSSEPISERPVIVDTAHIFSSDLKKISSSNVEVHPINISDINIDFAIKINEELDEYMIKKKSKFSSDPITTEEIDEIVNSLISEV